MLRFLADENFNGAIVRGLLRREPATDLVTVQDADLLGKSDHMILEWAADNDRLLLTHDIRTIPTYVNQRIANGLPMPGVIEVPSICPIREVIEGIILLDECSDDGEWEGQIVRLPF